MEQRDSSPDSEDGTWTWKDGSAARDATISALGRVFPEVHRFKRSCVGCVRRFPVAVIWFPSSPSLLIMHRSKCVKILVLVRSTT